MKSATGGQSFCRRDPCGYYLPFLRIRGEYKGFVVLDNSASLLLSPLLSCRAARAHFVNLSVVPVPFGACFRNCVDKKLNADFI